MERLKQLIEAPERKNKENETEAIFAEIMPEPFLDPHVQEVSKIPSRIKNGTLIQRKAILASMAHVGAL